LNWSDWAIAIAFTPSDAERRTAKLVALRVVANSTWMQAHTIARHDGTSVTFLTNIFKKFILQKQENTDFRAPYDLKGTDLDIASRLIRRAAR
jgi:hypothetical protein